MTDFSKTQKDYSVYLPAISSFFVKRLEQYSDPDCKLRVPPGFELGVAGMNFLNQENSYWHYPYGLYSAGHAEINVQNSKEREGMIQHRDRANTMILGDSGGFQIATGVLKMNWQNALDPNDPERTALCEKILRWLEATADWSMTLDIPAFAAVPPLSKKTGLTSFQDTLDISVLNLDYFVRNRVPGATKFLNVISGNSEDNSKQWYNTVKVFSDKKFMAENYTEDATLEGYAFAGINMKNMVCVLNRLLDLREDNLLHDKDWIHFLGTGKLQWACYLTSIQRQLRKHDNPNITLSFDAASPFVTVAFGQTYSHNVFSNKRFGYTMERAIDNQALKNSNLPMPFMSPIMDRLSVGDICVHEAGDLDNRGKAKDTKSTSWDTLSYALYMSHSVHNHILAVQEANRLADVEKHRAEISYTDWNSAKKSSTSMEISPYVPSSIIMFDKFAQHVLDPECKNPRKLIEQNRKFLESISFGGDARNSTFNSWFDHDEYEPDHETDMNHEIMRGDFNE